MSRIKRQALPDVRDAPLHDDNAAASCSCQTEMAKLGWRLCYGISASSPNEQDKRYRVRWAASDFLPFSPRFWGHLCEHRKIVSTPGVTQIQNVFHKNISHKIRCIQSQVRNVKGMIGTLSDSIQRTPAEGLSNVGRKLRKLCNSRGDSLPQAVFTFASSIHHRFFSNQDSLVVCSPLRSIFAQPHL